MMLSFGRTPVVRLARKKHASHSIDSALTDLVAYPRNSGHASLDLLNTVSGDADFYCHW